MTRRPVFDERAFLPEKPAEGLPLFAAVPDIRTPVPVAPGSASSERGAKQVTQPMRARSYRLIMLALGADGMLSREALSERTGIKESSLCGRLDELAPMWIDVVEDACIAKSGVPVNGYRLTPAGRARLKEAA